MHYYAQRAWGEAAEVTSAGTWAEVGMDATPELRRAAARYDLTIPRHRPTQLDAAAITRADLVLVASQQHADWIARRTGNAPTHVFGLLQAAELAQRAVRPVGDTATERLGAAASALAMEHQARPAPLRTLDDPWAQSDAVYERVVGEIVQALDVLTEWANAN